MRVRKGTATGRRDKAAADNDLLGAAALAAAGSVLHLLAAVAISSSRHSDAATRLCGVFILLSAAAGFLSLRKANPFGPANTAQLGPNRHVPSGPACKVGETTRPDPASCLPL